MNDYLIDIYKKKLIKQLIYMIIGLIAFYFLTQENMPTLILSAIIFIYAVLNNQGILLEINRNDDDDDVVFKSYSIIKGKKEFELDINKITDISFDDHLIVIFKNDYGKDIEKYSLNAKPWNDLYSQIKQLKLYIQITENLNQINIEK